MVKIILLILIILLVLLLFIKLNHYLLHMPKINILISSPEIIVLHLMIKPPRNSVVIVIVISLYTSKIIKLMIKNRNYILILALVIDLNPPKLVQGSYLKINLISKIKTLIICKKNKYRQLLLIIIIILNSNYIFLKKESNLYSLVIINLILN